MCLDVTEYDNMKTNSWKVITVQKEQVQMYGFKPA